MRYVIETAYKVCVCTCSNGLHGVVLVLASMPASLSPPPNVVLSASSPSDFIDKT
jgi:hypothetical protein